MRILFPVDGSRIQSEAVNALTRRFWPDGTTIKVVTVVAKAMGSKLDHFKQDEKIYQRETALARLVGELKEKLPGCAFKTAVYHGNVADEILAEAKAWPCDLIVMASHDRHGLERVLLGSVSHAVSMRAICPVFIIKANPHKSQQFARIVIALDHSQCSVEALKWVARIPWSGGTEILLLSVVDEMIERFSDETSVLRAADILNDWQKKQSKRTRTLNSLANKLKKATGLQSVNIRIASGDPEQVIVSEAESWDADLIVMGSHGRTGVSKMLMGSVAQAVLGHASCSVEIVKTENAHLNSTASGTECGMMKTTDNGETHAFPAGLV